jgi:hypothetical protein
MDSPTNILIKQTDAAGRRVFLSGCVLSCNERVVVALFEKDCGLRWGVVTDGFYQEGDVFMRQAYRVISSADEEDGTRVDLLLQGEPKSAEMRACERVTTIFEPMLATFGGEPNCLVLDISDVGIALVANGEYPVGTTLALESWNDQELLSGRVTIRSVSPAPRSKFRYGLCCEVDEEPHNLHAELRNLFVALQVKYLELVGC